MAKVRSFVEGRPWKLDPEEDQEIIEKITGSTLAEDTLSFLKQYITEFKVKRILEFGSGLSTLLNTKILQNHLQFNDYTYVSVDDSEKYLQITINSIQEKYPGHHVQFLHAPITNVKVNGVKLQSYSNKVLYPVIKSLEFDLVLIDGPMGHRYGREFPLYEALPALTDQTLILLDDSNRTYEQNNLKAWQRNFNGNIHVAELDGFQKGLTCISLTNTSYLKKEIRPAFFNKNKISMT